MTPINIPKMKRIIQVTFDFKNNSDFQKATAVYNGIEGAAKGSWSLYFKRGIKVEKFLRLDNYPLKAAEVTFEKALDLLMTHGFLSDRNEPENGY